MIETGFKTEKPYDFETEYKKNRPWLDLPYYQNEAAPVVEIKQKCIPDFLHNAAEKFPNKVALYFEGTEIRYKELQELVNRCASALVNMGVEKGDKVALSLPNIPQGVIAYFAIIKIGAVMIAENPLFSKEEFRAFMNKSGARVLITLDKIFKNKIADIIESIPLRILITTAVEDYLPFKKKYLYMLREGLRTLESRIKNWKSKRARFLKQCEVYDFLKILKASDADPPKRKIGWGDPISCFHTSGTTAETKSVVHSNEGLSSLCQQINALFTDVDLSRETFASIVPIFHSFGAQILLIAISNGSTIFLIPKARGEAILKSIEKHKPSLIPLTPPIYNEILHSPQLKKTDIRVVREFFCGSAPLPLNTFNSFKRMGVEIVAGYGILECIMAIINPRGEKGIRKAESIGIPGPNVDAVIVGKDGKICTPVKVDENGKANPPKPENIGELCLRAPQRMHYYDKEPKRTAQAYDEFGFLHSGDIGYMDEEGYFYILGRESDVFICGTSDVFPDEVEGEIVKHPAVMDACVIDIPHETLGSVPKAYIISKSKGAISARELIDFLKEKLATWKIPVEYEFVDRLPISTGGKKLRRVLRERENKLRKTPSNAQTTDKVLE
ncbi:MAG: class I adenylate-forming enzyme family protein [Candidatus Hodarchaeota archaeon]